MAALIIAIFPQNSSRGNWEEQQDRTDPNSQFELARKPAWLLAFRQFGLPKWKHDFESSGKNRTWRNLTEYNGRYKNPESAVFSRLSAPIRIENAVKIRVRKSPPISPSSNEFSKKPIRIFNRTERFFAPKSRFWQCVKSTGYAEPHQKSCRQMLVQNQNCRYRQKYK